MKSLLLLTALIMPLTVLADGDTMTIDNATGCLVDMDNSTVSYVKPVTIYTFKPISNGSYSYDNNSVQPGQMHAQINMYPNPYSTPALPAVFLGTSPGDAAPQITTNAPTSTDQDRIIVQEYSDMGACSEQYPCVGFLVSQTPASQCLTLLKKHQNAQA